MFKICIAKCGAVTGRALLSVTCLAFLAAPVFAQDPGAAASAPQQQQTPGQGPGDRQQQQLEHLTKALSLTPDQVAQVKAIQADGRSQMMAVRQDSTVAGPDKRAKMMSIHQAQDVKVRGVLNEEQKTKYDAMQAREQEHREERRNGSQAPTPPSA